MLPERSKLPPLLAAWAPRDDFWTHLQPIPSRGDASKGDDTGLGARIKSYDDAIPAVVKTWTDKGKHILIADMYTPFNPNKASLLEDQYHPNLAGYVLLGTQWYSVLQPLL